MATAEECRLHLGTENVNDLSDFVQPLYVNPQQFPPPFYLFILGSMGGLDIWGLLKMNCRVLAKAS